MVGSDLQGLFRSNDRDLRAVDVFTNREGEWAAVVDSIRNVAAAVADPAFDPEDVESPRRNVLSFYGVGGIGKTTLSRQIESRLAEPSDEVPQWSAPDPPLPRLLPVRIDLSRQHGMDFESLILTVRLAVAPLGPMPAFDLAFRRYWDQCHPNESLNDYLSARGLHGRFGGATQQQIEDALNDVAQVLGMPGMLGKLAGQGVTTLVRRIRERKRRLRALECKRLPDLLEAAPDVEALSFYPHLLAWDLAHVPVKRAAVPVVLLDTFEDVTDRSDLYLERLLQRLVWLMPNALFIVSGRNRLRWADFRLEGQLEWAGPQYWPQLSSGDQLEPCQHLVGYLSSLDCEDYLIRRLTREGAAVIPPPVRAAIVERSGGLPLYLDLAVMRFLSLYQADGSVPGVDEFDGDFAALVARTFRDLSPQERQVVRAASVLDGFSVELVTAAAGLTQDGAALRLVERPFVEHAPGGVWPYRLHTLVRDVVRHDDTVSDDRWSPRDWRAAALRAHAALGEQCAGPRRDGRMLLACMTQGLRLAFEFDLDIGWMADAAFRYVEDAVWLPMNIGPHEGYHNSAAALARTVNTIAARNRQHRADTARDLRAILAEGILPDDLIELPQYYLAMCERDLGNLSESLEGMRQVVAREGHLAGEATRGLLHLARRLGRFQEALALVDGLGPDGKPQRALGELWWSHGRIAAACTALANARDDAASRGWSGEAALCQAYLAFVAAFEDRPRALEQIARAESMLADAPVGFGDQLVTVAALLADAGHDDQLPSRAQQVAAQAAEAGLSSPVAYTRLVECFHAAVVGEDEGVAAARQQLSASVAGQEFAYLIEMSHMFTGTVPEAEWPRADWIDGEAQTRARWLQLVNDRRQVVATEGD